MIDVFIFIGWVRPECILIVDKTFSSKWNVMTTFQSCYSDAVHPAFFVTGLGKKKSFKPKKKGPLHKVCRLFSFSIWIRHVRLCNRGFLLLNLVHLNLLLTWALVACSNSPRIERDRPPADWGKRLPSLISAVSFPENKTPSDNPWRRSEERFASLYRHQPQRNKGLKSFPRWVKNFEAQVFNRRTIFFLHITHLKVQ